MHVLAGEGISGIVDTPSLSVEEKLSNINRVLEYMKKRHIRMHETLAQGIYIYYICTFAIHLKNFVTFAMHPNNFVTVAMHPNNFVTFTRS